MKESRLKDIFTALRYAATKAPTALELHQPRLVEVCSKVSFNKSHRPPKVKPEVLPKWRAAIEKKDYSQISLSDIRALCWLKDVALSSEFLELLFARKVTVRKSSLKGFTYALAARWSEVQSGALTLSQYEHALTQLSKSQFLGQISPYILNPAGHSKFAEELIRARSEVGRMFTEVFGISASTNEYTDEATGIVADSASTVALSTSAADREWFYSAILKHLPKGRLVSCLGKIVQGIESANVEPAKDELKAFILGHPNLGDPRLPGFEGNWDLRSPITQSIIEWLSQSDINFFFELFFEEKADVQGRKRFWLPYAHLIRGTRVVMSEADKRKHFKKLSDLESKGLNKRIFGQLNDRDVEATAFVMDFGKVKVVEFSRPNHACYFYDEGSAFKFNDRDKFWSTDRFWETDLKDKEKSSNRLSHTPNWEGKFSNYLAGLGIRPRGSSGRSYY